MEYLSHGLYRDSLLLLARRFRNHWASHLFDEDMHPI